MPIDDIGDKGGGFGNVPDSVFKEMVKEYQQGAFTLISERDRIDTLAALAEAEHAALTAKSSPDFVEYILVIIDLQNAFRTFQSATPGAPDRIQAQSSIAALLAKMKGFFSK